MLLWKSRKPCNVGSNTECSLFLWGLYWEWGNQCKVMPCYFWVQVETKAHYIFCSDRRRETHNINNNLFTFLFMLPVQQRLQYILVKLEANLDSLWVQWTGIGLFSVLWLFLERSNYYSQDVAFFRLILSSFRDNTSLLRFQILSLLEFSSIFNMWFRNEAKRKPIFFLSTQWI